MVSTSCIWNEIFVSLGSFYFRAILLNQKGHMSTISLAVKIYKDLQHSRIQSVDWHIFWNKIYNITLISNRFQISALSLGWKNEFQFLSVDNIEKSFILKFLIRLVYFLYIISTLASHTSFHKFHLLSHETLVIPITSLKMLL